MKPSFDEAKEAKEIAKLIGTSHHEIYFFNDFKRLIDDINYAYDEPFSDSSQLPTILLSKLPKKRLQLLCLEMVVTNYLLVTIDIF